MTGSGHFSPLPHRNSAGRFTSGSSRNSDKAALTLRAIRRPEQVQQKKALFDHIVG
jgi:hypothetical protein